MDLQTAKDHIEDLMGDRDQLLQRQRQLEDRVKELEKSRNYWRNIATMFYDQHENRRSCSLLASCKRCDAYEKAVRGD